jgi:sensor histidine kinase YesM
MSNRRLILWFTVGWMVSALLAMLAFRAAVSIGTLRVSGAMATTPLWRTQIAPWVSVALLTPLVVWLALRLSAARLPRPLYLLAHLGLAAAFLLAYTSLTLEILALLAGASEARLTLRAIAGRAATSAVLAMTKYAVIVAGTEAARHYGEARARADERDRLALQTVTLERDLSSARLAALRQQLQPHFLFNAMNAASSLIEESPARARELIARLADLLRLSLARGDAPSVTLGEELDFTDRYLAVERARFGDRLRITYEIDERALGTAVPAFVLQPLIENAIRHGFARLPSGGAIAIGAERTGARLELWVRSDRPAGSVVGPEGVGLAQVRARLAVLHGSDATLATATPDDTTFEARLTLPVAVRPGAAA